MLLHRPQGRHGAKPPPGPVPVFRVQRDAIPSAIVSDEGQPLRRADDGGRRHSSAKLRFLSGMETRPPPASSQKSLAEQRASALSNAPLFRKHQSEPRRERAAPSYESGAVDNRTMADMIAVQRQRQALEQTGGVISSRAIHEEALASMASHGAARRRAAEADPGLCRARPRRKAATDEGKRRAGGSGLRADVESETFDKRAMVAVEGEVTGLQAPRWGGAAPTPAAPDRGSVTADEAVITRAVALARRLRGAARVPVVREEEAGVEEQGEEERRRLGFVAAGGGRRAAKAIFVEDSGEEADAEAEGRYVRGKAASMARVAQPAALPENGFEEGRVGAEDVRAATQAGVARRTGVRPVEEEGEGGYNDVAEMEPSTRALRKRPGIVVRSARLAPAEGGLSSSWAVTAPAQPPAQRPAGAKTKVALGELGVSEAPFEEGHRGLLRQAPLAQKGNARSANPQGGDPFLVVEEGANDHAARGVSVAAARRRGLSAVATRVEEAGGEAESKMPPPRLSRPSVRRLGGGNGGGEGENSAEAFEGDAGGVEASLVGRRGLPFRAAVMSRAEGVADEDFAEATTGLRDMLQRTTAQRLRVGRRVRGGRHAEPQSLAGGMREDCPLPNRRPVKKRSGLLRAREAPVRGDDPAMAGEGATAMAERRKAFSHPPRKAVLRVEDAEAAENTYGASDPFADVGSRSAARARHIPARAAMAADPGLDLDVPDRDARASTHRSVKGRMVGALPSLDGQETLDQ